MKFLCLNKINPRDVKFFNKNLYLIIKKNLIFFYIKRFDLVDSPNPHCFFRFLPSLKI